MGKSKLVQKQSRASLIQRARKLSKKASTTPAPTVDHSIPLPPPRPSRADHHRPFTPAMVRSKSSQTAASRPSAAVILAKAARQRTNSLFDTRPWATPPVDRLICGLDGQGYDYASIVRQVKQKFPSLQAGMISIDMLHARLAILDYRIELDYFGKGLKKTERRMKRSASREHRVPGIKHRRKGKGKDKKVDTVEGASRAIPRLPGSGPVIELGSRGARHGKAIADCVNDNPSPEQLPPGDVAAPMSSSVETAESAGARHGKLIHQERTSHESAAMAAPMANSMVKSDDLRGKGIEHGKAIHHDRNQSNVSSTVTGTTAVNLPSIDETQPSPDGVAYYNRPTTPATSEGSAARAHPATASYPPISPTPALPPLDNQESQSRATRLGRVIQSTVGQSWIPTPKGKLHVTNGMKEEELLTSPRSTPTPSHCTAEEQLQLSSTPNEFKKKRNTGNSLQSTAKENKAQRPETVRPSLDGRLYSDDAEPGPSSFIPKPLSIKRSESAATQARSQGKKAEKELALRTSHEARVSPKVGN